MEGELSFDTGDGGWYVKIYEKLHPENIKTIEKPEEHETVKYCEIKYEAIKSLPNWDGIEDYCVDAQKLSCLLDKDEPWENYQEIVQELVGEQEIWSQLGGYPHWIQGSEKPEKGNFELLFQIDSEDNAGLMWGDCGLVYVFYDNVSKELAFTLQCY